MISRRVNRRGGGATQDTEGAEGTDVAPSAESIDPPRLRLALKVRHIPDHRSFAGGIYIFAGVGPDGAPLYRNASGCAISRQPVLAPDASERYGASGEPVWTIASTQVRGPRCFALSVDLLAHVCAHAFMRVYSPPSFGAVSVVLTLSFANFSRHPFCPAPPPLPARVPPPVLCNILRTTSFLQNVLYYAPPRQGCADAAAAAAAAPARAEVPLGPTWRAADGTAPSTRRLTVTVAPPPRVESHGKALTGEQAEGIAYNALRQLRRGAMLLLRTGVEGEFILFTVTFCANPAHNLTRSTYI